MLVKTSIITPIMDQFFPRTMKYRPIKRINAKKQSTPSDMLTGYSIGNFDDPSNITIASHRNAQASPAAPTPDKPNDIAEVFILQCVCTVFENSKQKPDEMTTLMPSKINAIGQPPYKRDRINQYVGPSIPPTIPVVGPRITIPR